MARPVERGVRAQAIGGAPAADALRHLRRLPSPAISPPCKERELATLVAIPTPTETRLSFSHLMPIEYGRHLSGQDNPHPVDATL